MGPGVPKKRDDYEFQIFFKGIQDFRSHGVTTLIHVTVIPHALFVV
jgi:hypothetical protein